MRRCTYTLALYVLAPLIWLWMGRRARRAGGGWGILSKVRFGGADENSPAPFATPPVWVHAVSLGETRAAQPVIHALLQRGLPVLLTHMTATGRAEGARLFPDAIASGQLRQTWLPYDFPGAVRRFLTRYTPRCGLLIEREIWPNLLAQARLQGVRMALVSARFSASSLRQTEWMGRVLRDAFAGLDRVLAQTAEDAQRLEQVGARQISITGNIKFDVQIPQAQYAAGQAWRRAIGRPVVAIASTREGEDALFVQAICASRDKALGGGNALHLDSACESLVKQRGDVSSPVYVLIPRHPQRFDDVAQQLDAAGLTYVRRSQTHTPLDLVGSVYSECASYASVDAIIGDTLGEMAFYYATADVAIVAGSFLPFGGQNLIEACAVGVPVIVGPHTFNFKQAADDAIAAVAVLRSPDVPQAIGAALALLQDESRRLVMGQAARDWSAAHAGATARTLDALDDLLAT